MQEKQDYEAIICGAGVGGLALAVALGRQGRKVLVVEKLRHEAKVHRGELLQPHTLEILDEWGVLPYLNEQGSLHIDAMEARSATGEYMGELNYTELEETYNYGLAQYYHETKAALYGVAHKVADISYGTRVLDLVRDEAGHVCGVKIAQGQLEEEVRAPLTVAADGRTSRIRQLMGIEVKMHDYQHQLMGLDLEKAPPLPPRMCAYLSKQGVRVLYPMPHGHARLYVQIKPGEFAEIKRQGYTAWKEELLKQTPALKFIADYLPSDLSGAQLQGAWSYSAPLWSRGCVALSGDAAHYVHPTAGQGMNAAIIDAWSLANALQETAGAQQLTRVSVEQALHIYDQRRKDFDFTGTLCHEMAELCTSTSRGRRALAYWGWRIYSKNRAVQYRVMREIAGYSTREFSLIERLLEYSNLRHLPIGKK
jgi:2-polyprenyl-6-methoxyphenol hydroxylase-like FAD-dependent oxidoreductase